MTASSMVKMAGLNSLNELSDITGVSRQTLSNWYKNNMKLFVIVINGAVVHRLTTDGDLPMYLKQQAH